MIESSDIDSADITAAVDALERAGCIAAAEEAALLVQAADGDRSRLRATVERRGTGEPLAWIIGSVQFCGLTVAVDRGVYVPRWQTEPMARAAAALLPDDGTAVDLCTGAGALAVVLADRHPQARVIGIDLDPVAVACARSNGVEAVEADLATWLPVDLRGNVDLVVGVVPYVPTGALEFLPRDVQTYEPSMALDGGVAGTDLLVRAVEVASGLLVPGGHLFLELGANQPDHLQQCLKINTFTQIEIREDQEGDTRYLSATQEKQPT